MGWIGGHIEVDADSTRIARVGRKTAAPIENMFIPCKQRSDLADETLGNGTMEKQRQQDLTEDSG
jgi:hypothetical protein